MIAERTDQLKGMNEYLLEGIRLRDQNIPYQTNRALKILSELNKALIHNVSEKELLDRIGKITGVLAFVSDITGLTYLKNALLESETGVNRLWKIPAGSGKQIPPVRIPATV